MKRCRPFLCLKATKTLNLLNMGIRFGPAGLGPVASAIRTLEAYHAQGFRACEIAFTYSAYIKNEADAIAIGKKAKELGISLSIHGPYFVNLNSSKAATRKITHERLLRCCEIAHQLGGATVVFHPGFYGKSDKEATYETIKEGLRALVEEVKKRKWNAVLAPETMGKVNVFGSIHEIAKLAQETGSGFCIDYAHLLARDKKVDYALVEKLFPQKKWHVHFSGIIYGEKGEKSHKTTEKGEWETLLRNLPKDRDITIINESPTMHEDTLMGISLAKKQGLQLH